MEQGRTPWTGMFGLYRTILALFVVLQHFYACAPLGNYAVYAFFSLSGFLMTLLMCEAYRGRPLDFAINRFLRLYPAYWVVAGATAVIIRATPIEKLIGGEGNWGWGLPTDATGLLRNALFLVDADNLRLVPTGWAVTNELLYYGLIGLGATQTLARSLICLAIAGGLTLWRLHAANFYFSPFAAAFPFAVGAVAYHFQRSSLGRAVLSSQWLAPSAVALALTIGYVRDLGLSAGMAALYLHMLSAVPLMLILYRIEPSRTMRRVDDAIGTLSYPIYLSQFFALLLITRTPPFWLGTWWFSPSVVVVTLLVSIALVFAVDRPVERLRQRVRARAVARGSVRRP